MQVRPHTAAVGPWGVVAVPCAPQGTLVVTAALVLAFVPAITLVVVATRCTP